jgi:hypothetical protein
LEAGLKIRICTHSQSAFLFVLSLLSGLLAVPACAQHARASIDAGALNMQYADSIDANAIAVTPSFWIDSRQAAFSSTATLSQFAGGGWSAQGSADGSLFTPRMGLFIGEIEGSAGGSTRNDGSRTGQVLASARAHISSDRRGIWLGAGIGGTWDGVEWRNVRQGEAAAWTRVDNASLFLSATPVVVDDSIRYTDGEIAGELNLARVDLDASAGFRAGSRLPTLGGTAKSWGSASITGWIASRIAVVASAGTYPVDLTQGFPGGRFASLSIRFGSRRYTPPRAPVLAPLPRSSFMLGNPERGTRQIRIRMPSADKVEIMGDFTGWAPVALQSEGNEWWSVRLPVKPGIHELNVRFNGGEWTVPRGMEKKSDEFGGAVGVFVVQL